MYVLSFSQDSFGRLHDRGKEVPKATKLLTKLFPNKVTIHLPQVCMVDSTSLLTVFLLSTVYDCSFFTVAG